MQDLHAHMNMETFFTTGSCSNFCPNTVTCLHLIDGPLSMSSSNERQDRKLWLFAALSILIAYDP